MSFDLTITFGVPPFSHNVTTKQNMIIGWIPEMANGSVENNGAWHIALATPIKLVGALNLGIKLGIFLDTPPKVDAPVGLGIMFTNRNDCGTSPAAFGVEPHHIENLISH